MNNFLQGFTEGITETLTGKKKTPREKVSATIPSTQAIEPKQEKSTMSKPSSYFSVKEYTFISKGRKENKGKDIESKEPALFFENEVMAIPFQPMPTVPAKMKYVRLANIKEMVSILEKGYPEETTGILLKEGGYKELVKTLKESKILCLDFLSFLKEELAKIPSKPRGRQAGSGSTKSKTDKGVSALVSILVSMAPIADPEELVEMFKGLATDKDRMEKAVKVLEEKAKENGRDEKGYIRLRIRTGKKGGK